MEGGGDGFRLGDIGNYTEITDLYPLGVASLFGINMAIASARLGNIGGPSLNTYFDTFGLEGILANIALIMIIFQLARWIYTVGYNGTGAKAWSPFIFICILLVVQALHDIIFYYGAIKVMPSHANEMIDLLKKYADQNGARAIGGHAVLLTIIGVLGMVFKEVSTMFRICIIIGTLYAMPYLIAMARSKPVKEVVAVVQKVETKEAPSQMQPKEPKQEPKQEPKALSELDAFYSRL